MTSVTLQAITVLGHDRPGIIAQTTGILAELGLNLEDSSMTLLRGHFAMTLICAGAVPSAEIERALAPLAEGSSLTVTVREVPEEPEHASVAASYVLTVHGGDRPGIVSAIAADVAAVGGNITDLTTRLAGDLYLLVAEVDLPAGVDATALEASLTRVAAGLGVDVGLRPVESDEL
ncbi:MAG TPA: ACT domain-containing protein [Nocardioidaceae bacterium]|nr:ACT domain-containing protein [Nocardioidaceae bacterium]